LPAIDGTKNILLATKREPKIRRVVFTPSTAAVIDPSADPATKPVGPDDWSNVTYEEAKNSTNFIFPYRASKAFAERTFWEFIKTEKPSWDGIALCPWYVASLRGLPPRFDAQFWM
jgi:nucleoside-diphosphate-sugar epimerase